jgi:hypothetical protein
MEEVKKVNISSAIRHIEWLILFVTLLAKFHAMASKIDAMTSRFDQLMFAWHEESKYFHGRLERNKGK